MVPSDLFQGFIVIPHRDWATIQLPFANMAYTGYGYGKFEKKQLDPKGILSVGFVKCEMWNVKCEMLLDDWVICSLM